MMVHTTDEFIRSELKRIGASPKRLTKKAKQQNSRARKRHKKKEKIDATDILEVLIQNILNAMMLM